MYLGLIKKRLQRGDTIIEVMLAIVIFSLVIIGSIAIMNSGTATAQRSLEITLVREEMNTQAETLRFLNASYLTAFNRDIKNYSGYAGQWQAIQERSSLTQVSDFSSCPISKPNQSFILNTRTASVDVNKFSRWDEISTYSQVRYTNNDISSADSIWIEAVKSTTVNQAGYIDFYIRACWSSPGQSVPEKTDTVVRLYEPR